MWNHTEHQVLFKWESYENRTGLLLALVFDADEKVKDVPALAAAAIRQMRERDHTFNIFYSKKDSGVGAYLFMIGRSVFPETLQPTNGLMRS